MRVNRLECATFSAYQWPNHPLAKRRGRPPPMGWPATRLAFSFLDFF
jgi:hypothetical protein